MSENNISLISNFLYSARERQRHDDTEISLTLSATIIPKYAEIIPKNAGEKRK